MSWYLIALLGTLLWSVGNFIDKILSDRFSRNIGGIWSLALFSSLFSGIVLTGLALWQPSVVMIEPRYAGVLFLAGAAEITGIFLYLKALREEDTSTVVPFFQMVPFFSFGLGYVILGETLTLSQALAGLVVILGGVLLSLELSAKRKLTFNVALISIMLLSSFCFSLLDSLFKAGALETSYWSAIFWQHVGIFVPGLVVFLFHHNARSGFVASLRESAPTTIGLNLLNESLYVGGMMLFSLALTMASVALVATVNVFQPVFVFMFGTVLTMLFPKLIREDISRSNLVHKAIAIAIIVIASIFLIS